MLNIRKFKYLKNLNRTLNDLLIAKVIPIIPAIIHLLKQSSW